MRIGVIKPGKTIYMKTENAKQFEGTSYLAEIVNLIKILRAAGHTVDILSETDEEQKSYICSLYDVVLFYNGVQCDSVDTILSDMHSQQCVIFAYTDMMLPCYMSVLVDISDNVTVLSQSRSMTMSKVRTEYFPFEELITYGFAIPLEYNKTVRDIVFIGNQKSLYKTNTVTEFMLSAGIPAAIYGTWTDSVILQYSEFKGKIKFSDGQKLLKASMFGFVCSDEINIVYDAMTQRYWENTINGCVNIMHFTYDRARNLSMHKIDQRVVYRLDDLHKILDAPISTVKEIVQEQYEQVTSDMSDGSKFLSQFERVCKEAIIE